MTDEAIPTAAHPDLKARKLFSDGTEIVAAINGAERTQGRFAPGLAVELKTILPAEETALQALESPGAANGKSKALPKACLKTIMSRSAAMLPLW